jgi:hypothetical protein
MQHYFLRQLPRSIKQLSGFPQIDSIIITRFPPNIIKGHLDQNRKNKSPTIALAKILPLMALPNHNNHAMNLTTLSQLSTEMDNNQTNEMEESHIDMMPTHEEPAYLYCAALVPIEKTGMVYTDQTGRFPTTSSMGNTNFCTIQLRH